LTLRQTSKEGGVSPVVGVILMVAVTVILAAVIGSFVLDLGSNVQANPQAGVTFSEKTDGTDTDVAVQVISMENADSLQISTSEAATNTNYTGAGDTSGAIRENITDVGQVTTVEVVASSETITVVGELDGKESVIQTFTVG
jgi:flagellin-like protein